ncbi:MAG: amidase [Steroidobacteraceae bacterium]|jgi:aspartyl-tRNA(Asn)/glutamyl-tRNA(Gln) amidotransferase subunit A|nr:amidase [Steroidobacteraceae bacterium]
MTPQARPPASPREFDAADAAAALRRGEFSSLELVEDCLGALSRDNPALGAWTFVDAAGARAAARAADERRARGALRGALDGLPAAIKANLAVAGWPHTAGLRFRAADFAAEDAFAVARLRAAGVVLLGATNMDEGALGAEGMNPWYGVTHNPQRAGHSAGGSSSGSAAAIAARHCTLALGSDTIGSLRIPAAFCGTASLKPTSGLVSLSGVVPVHLRFDHVGPIVRTARDLSPLLQAIAGHDPACRVSFPVQLAPPRAADPARVTLGYAVGLGEFAVGPEVVAAYNRGISALRALGAQLVPVDLRRWDLARVRRAILALCEREMWRVHHQRVVDTPDDFSDGLRAFIRYGGRLSDEDLAAAEQRIAAFVGEWNSTTAPYEAIVMPTVACTAFPHGERHPHNTADLTAIASASGAPAASIPLPVPTGVLPVGLQLVGRAGHDLRLCQLAAAVEAQLAFER